MRALPAYCFLVFLWVPQGTEVKSDLKQAEGPPPCWPHATGSPVAMPSQSWGAWMMGGVWTGWRGFSDFVEAAHRVGLPGVLTVWRQPSGYDWSSVPWGEGHPHFLSLCEGPAPCPASFAPSSH